VRSAAALVALLLWVFGLGTVVLYLGVVPASWVWPRRRRALASAFMRLMSRGILRSVILGGARLERSGTLPTDAPGLIVMNHQSLLDICSLTLMSTPQAPAFVTRSRYGRGIPVISPCVRMIGSPIIDPKRDPKAAVELMRGMSASLQNGVVLFPEGHRSKDGALRVFRTNGAEALLHAQPTPLWLAVTDGFWRSPRLLDFVFNMHLIRGRTEVLGRLEAPPPEADVKALMEDVRERIAARLEALRAEPDAPAPSLLPEALVEAIRARATAGASGEAMQAARALAEAGGGEVEAVVFFGSRMTNARPGAGSAIDFFVVARHEGRLYQAWKRAGLIGRSPALLAALGHVLPPTSLAITTPDGAGGTLFTKCAVSSRATFERDTSLRHRDHFTLGRLFQRTSLAYTRDAEAEAWAVRALARAHLLTFRWARPWLPARFDGGEYAQALLRRSFRGEIRPEPVDGRVAALFAAQDDYLRAVYGVLLEELERRGDLRREADGRFALRRPVSRWERFARGFYFRVSMARATLRWAKHVVSFEGWLDFLVRKARRHSGQEIELTERERRAPLIFLWPRVWRYLRHKDD
jgi:1-acyl-sn-glycerol-3-phosphate acyltransferase